jgi:hypothetical protein
MSYLSTEDNRFKKILRSISIGISGGFLGVVLIFATTYFVHEFIGNYIGGVMLPVSILVSLFVSIYTVHKVFDTKSHISTVTVVIMCLIFASLLVLGSLN